MSTCVALRPTDRHAPWTDGPQLGPAPRFDPPAAHRFCAALAAGHYENFPVALALFDPDQRRALAAVYAFARLADDFADEPEFAGVRDRLLDGWAEALERAVRGEAHHPVFVALADAIRRHDLEPRDLHALLDAFRQDVRRDAYDRFDELLDYCRRSAAPVGRLVLRILRADDERTVACSDKLCTALQLTNFWQDLSVDLPRGRCYLPRHDGERFGVTPETLRAAEPTAGVERLLRFETGRTAGLFAEGLPLLARVGWPGVAYLSAVWAGGRAVLAMVEALGPTVLRRRPALRGAEGLRWAATAAARRWGGGTVHA